ncbi:hypothetical protein [Limosilactobacillus frumenti]|uniref:hypothetical protein n=1 Tax=Limosilactobacillus frumenti TaxID=104955 RepID=UPI00070E8418|nr:hypothetical protein [Limosilactobacillus frumenti]MBA2914577.1 hypothetical protein [Limosilactobacillus frumenti]QFG72054.1 hypothetical protein LF145_01080 [Limosilactobacillus frumenti]
MKNFLKFIGLFLCLSIVTIVYGCSNSANTSNTKKQTLSGVYKISNKDVDKDEAGKPQPGYYYFKKNGQMLWAKADTGDGDQGYYGDAARGTWKSLGNNKFRIHMKYIYDNDDLTFNAKKSGNKLHTYSNSRKAKYEWDADDNYKQPDMTYSDFMVIFNNGKKSEQKKVQENGYDKPDNGSNSTNSSSNSSSNNDSVKINNADDALAYLKQQKGDGNYTISHGTFGMSDNPYATIMDEDSGTQYIVYQDGKIEENND